MDIHRNWLFNQKVIAFGVVDYFAGVSIRWSKFPILQSGWEKQEELIGLYKKYSWEKLIKTDIV